MPTDFDMRYIYSQPSMSRVLISKYTIFYQRMIGTRRKICIFIYNIKCQSIYYNSVKFQVNRFRNKKVTIYRSALPYKQEGASLRHSDFMLIDGSDEIGYFLWKFQSRALLT